jgi:uncharacterized protein (TIGR03118 family)
MQLRNHLAGTWFLALLVVGPSSPALAQFYEQRNLVSDGAIPAAVVDPDLVNAWGLVSSATSPFWVADNGTGKSTLYNVSGATPVKLGLTVLVPGSPTGAVFNTRGAGFAVPGGVSRFIFSSEDGTISGWPGTGTQAFVAVTKPGAIYKGLAFAQTDRGDFLYATNFHDGTVDVFNSSFGPVITAAFADPGIPKGYAPFGIQNVSGTIFVTYALQDEDREDDVPGEGHGYVNAFDTAGNLLYRVASKDELNSPWGIAVAPDDFGKFSGDLLIGNFGDGRIHAFRFRRTGRGELQHHGLLHSAEGRPIEIPGLWALEFGNGAAAGPKTTLFFTAGPFDEQNGLFGSLQAVGPPGHNR